MYISRLEVQGLRMLRDVSMEPSKGLNLVVGLNAAGKTSLLEAVNLLGTGRSFRTRNLGELAERGGTGFRLFAEVVGEEGRHSRLGLAREGNQLHVRIGGQRASAGSQLARELIVALIRPESQRLVSGGPAERRRWLDWGLFHVEPGYHGALQRYRGALRQRNAALRSGERSLGGWERELCDWGERISAYRMGYVGALSARVADMAVRLLGDPVEMGYRQGWRQGSTLAVALTGSRGRDRALGTTTVGPHRADLGLVFQGLRLEESLSRGQEKLLVGALVLAQVAQVQLATGRQAVLLVDDLAAELDEANRGRFLDSVAETSSQAFVTSVKEDLGALDAWEHSRLFHVEQGEIREVV